MKASKHINLFKLKSAIVADMWVMRCANIIKNKEISNFIMQYYVSFDVCTYYPAKTAQLVASKYSRLTSVSTTKNSDTIVCGQV